MDLKKIICIDLAKLSDKKLRIINDYIGLIPDYLIKTKKSGVKKIWLQPGNSRVFKMELSNKAAENNLSYNKNIIGNMSINESKKLNRIKPNDFSFLFQTENSKSKNVDTDIDTLLERIIEPNLHVDKILDKISISGIGSLTKGELEFLNKYSNMI
jgi:hypothetical protein